MANPFTIRATEFVKSNEAFLTLIAPDPVTIFLEPHARGAGLYRKLVSIQGQPGSGKTTIARLFEFSTLVTLLRGRQNETYSELIGPLQKCDAVCDGVIKIIACRLPLESDYRELSQMPYSERVRSELLQRLIQARAMLALFSQLSKVGVEPTEVSLELRDEMHVPVSFIGGNQGPQMLARARSVEAAIYRIIGALLPPLEAEIESQLLEPYRPFEVMDSIRLSRAASVSACAAEILRPLIILDDAHFLHSKQLEELKTWLVRRELSIGRWILSRLDVLQPMELFDTLLLPGEHVNMPGITSGRDIIQINLQGAKRAESRKYFRMMAREMSKKYLGQMKIFVQNSITSLESLMPSRVGSISPSNCEKLKLSVLSIAKRFKISEQRIGEFDLMTCEFLSSRDEKSDDLRWAIIRILIYRYLKRTPQQSLFPDDTDGEPSKPLRVDLGVYDGACIQLMHEYDRPYYIGLDALSDAASENAETFLRIASHIVDAAENLLIKQKPSAIPAREQHKLLIERATLIIDSWNFPDHRRMRVIAQWIADKCKDRTLEPNAPLGHGANAYGILQTEFESLEREHPILATVLKFGVAYNAITLVPKYPCKNKEWCLIELGGVYVVKSGLPFKRGGFVEGSSDELNEKLNAIS